jgi:hypothetical protein
MTKLNLRSSGKNPEERRSLTLRRKMKITPSKASMPFSRLKQKHLKIARLKDTREYQKINNKLLVCQLFPAALLLSYLIAIILQPRRKCLHAEFSYFPQSIQRKKKHD